MFRSEITAGYYSDKSAKMNLQMKRPDFVFDPLCEYWSGAGVNLLSVESAIESFEHTKFLYKSGETYRRMRIKADKFKVVVKDKIKINKEETEMGMCRIFPNLVAGHIYNQGFQNIFYTYSDSVHRYFDFIICPVCWMNGRVLDIEDFIEWLSPYFIESANICGYERPEVSAL